jgi:hypothetical protein
MWLRIPPSSSRANADRLKSGRVLSRPMSPDFCEWAIGVKTASARCAHGASRGDGTAAANSSEQVPYLALTNGTHSSREVLAGHRHQPIAERPAVRGLRVFEPPLQLYRLHSARAESPRTPRIVRDRSYPRIIGQFYPAGPRSYNEQKANRPPKSALILPQSEWVRLNFLDRDTSSQSSNWPIPSTEASSACAAFRLK